jgi:hypothetical protein
MVPAWSGEIANAVEKSRPQVCLIRSVRVERIIGRRCLQSGNGDSPRSCIKLTLGTLSAPGHEHEGHAILDDGRSGSVPHRKGASPQALSFQLPHFRSCVASLRDTAPADLKVCASPIAMLFRNRSVSLGTHVLAAGLGVG